MGKEARVRKMDGIKKNYKDIRPICRPLLFVHIRGGIGEVREA